MHETLQTNDQGMFNVDPLCIRDKYIETSFAQMGAFGWNSLHPANSSRPFVIREIEALAEAGSLSSESEFEDKLNELGRAYYEMINSDMSNEVSLQQTKLQTIQDVYERMRFFWEDKGPFDLGSLYSIQRLINKPLWSEKWTFREQVKPPHQFSQEYGDLNQIYQRLEVGSIIEVSERWAGNGSNPDKGKIGEVLGFTIGLQAQFNMDYLIVTFKDKANWLHQDYLYTLNLLA